MVDSIASSAALDLSALPAPVLVAQPDFETRLSAKLARVIAEWADFSALLESDPAMKLLQADTYDEMVLAQSFNDAARGLLLAFATGANLDQLGAIVDCPRLTLVPADPVAGTPAVMEADAAFRQRIQLAPHAFSVAGPELAYVYHARAAHADVADATAVSPTPGQVVVTVLSRLGNGVPADGVLAAVTTALTGPVRPLTDEVLVAPVALVDVAITASLWIFAGPDAALIHATALASLDAYLAAQRKLGRDVSPSGIIAALHVANVQRVDLASPSVPVAISPGQLAHVTGIDVTIAGTIV